MCAASNRDKLSHFVLFLRMNYILWCRVLINTHLTCKKPCCFINLQFLAHHHENTSFKISWLIQNQKLKWIDKINVLFVCQFSNKNVNFILWIQLHKYDDLLLFFSCQTNQEMCKYHHELWAITVTIFPISNTKWSDNEENNYYNKFKHIPGNGP